MDMCGSTEEEEKNVIDYHYFAHENNNKHRKKNNSKSIFRPSAISYSYEQKLSYLFRPSRNKAMQTSQYNLKK